MKFNLIVNRPLDSVPVQNKLHDGSLNPLEPILAFGSNLIGNLFGSHNTSKTNQTNLQIARETNQANLDLYREQYRDQYRLWQENNEYNSPASQVARLRAAGLNPGLNLGSNPTGQAQAASAPAAHAMVGATMQPFLPSFSDIAPNMAALAQSFKTNEETKGLAISNSFARQLKIQELVRNEAEIKLALQNVKKGSAEESLLNAQLIYNRLQYRLFSETYDQQKQSFDLQNQLTQQNIGLVYNQAKAAAANAAFLDSQTALNGIHLRYLPQQLESAISETMASISMMASNMEVNDATIENIYQRTLTEKEVTKGKQQENELFKRTAPYVVQQAKENILNSRNQRFNNTARTFIQFGHELNSFRHDTLNFLNPLMFGKK